MKYVTILLLAAAVTLAGAANASKQALIDEIEPNLLGVLGEYGPINASRGESLEEWDDLLAALDNWNTNAGIFPDVNETIPFYGNDSVPVWYPPPETFIWKGNNDTDDVSAVYGRVIHDILANMTFYGADEVLTNYLDIFGAADQAPTLLSMLSMGVPEQDQMIVRISKTNLVADTMAYFMNKAASQDNVDPNDPGPALASILGDFFSDYDSQVWKDVSVVMGPPLGPAIIPFMRSNFNSSQSGQAQSNPNKFPKFLDSFRLMGIRTLLYNKYMPIPCLKRDAYCPALDTDYVKAFAESYDLAARNETSEERFAYDFQDAMFQYFDDFGLNVTLSSIMSGIINNDTTSSVGSSSVLSSSDEISTHLPLVLNSLAENDYSVSMDQDITGSGFDPRVAVCTLNISSALYESPETMNEWLEDGHGFEIIDVFPVAGDLSSRGAVMVDREQNAVIYALEGIPVIHKYFQRGFFGWLSTILQGGTTAKPFEFPCSEMDFKVDELCICTEMAAKYYGKAAVYPGFAPWSTSIVNKLRPALSRSVSMLRHESANATAAAKPKLYITGHSLGGPLAKHTLAQMFLREYDQDFSSIDLYAFGGAMEGNLDFIEMIDEMASSPSVVPTRIYQVENQHDPWPYIPTVFGATGPVRKGKATFLFDLGEDALVRQEPGTPREFEGMPANVLLSMEGIHAPKTAYLPLTRALVPDYDYTTCEAICSVEQCGRFKCGGDYCTGIL